MKTQKNYLLLMLMLFSKIAFCQEKPVCEVLVTSLSQSYVGDCKKGLAHGQGEAKGLVHSYKGDFKKGYPDGVGEMRYNENAFYLGNLQKGLKEGKGEMHYLQEGQPDSLLIGYWSGDIYRGNKYITHSFMTTQVFDRKELRPSPGDGNTLNIETSGNFTPLTVSNVICMNGVIRRTSTFDSANKQTVTYQIDQFPAILQVTLSSGALINMELYKSAHWNMSLFLNR